MDSQAYEVQKTVVDTEHMNISRDILLCSVPVLLRQSQLSLRLCIHMTLFFERFLSRNGSAGQEVGEFKN